MVTKIFLKWSNDINRALPNRWEQMQHVASKVNHFETIIFIKTAYICYTEPKYLKAWLDKISVQKYHKA